MIKKITASLLMVSLLSLLAGAEDQTRPTFEITPFGGYRMSGSLTLNDPSYQRLDFGDGGVYGIAVGLDVPVEDKGDGAVEFMWTHQDSTLQAQAKPGFTDIKLNMNVDQFHLNGLYLWPSGEKFRPYVLAGLGATRFAPTGDESSLSLFSWALGLGAKVPLTNRLGLRFEAKWDPALSNASSSVFCSSSSGQCFVSASGKPINQFDYTAGLTLRI